MALLCSTCRQPIHWKNENGQKRVYRCPLASFKDAKMYYTKDLRNIGLQYLSLSDDPEDIKTLAELIPAETPLNQHIKAQSFKQDGFVVGGVDVRVKSIYALGSKIDFFLHFNRVLIDLFEKNPTLHFVPEEEDPGRSQFNYKILNPLNFKEAYFKEAGKSKFDSLTSLMAPSLLIYPLGQVHEMAQYSATRGDIILSLIAGRAAEGKATWFTSDKPLSMCPEIQSNPKLENALKTEFPKVIFDETDSSSARSELIAESTKKTTSTDKGSYF